jgi:hypothetical protein
MFKRSSGESMLSSNQVLALHILVVMRAAYLTNWRVKLAYHPEVVRLIVENGRWADQAASGPPATPIFLRSSFESDRMRARVEATIEIIGGHARVEQVWPEGDCPLAQALSAIYLGDFVTVYLALRLGRDPMDLEAISRLKSALGGNT